MGTFIAKGCEQGTQLAAILTENHIKVSLTQCSALNLSKKSVDILDFVTMRERVGHLTVSIVSTHWYH